MRMPGFAAETSVYLSQTTYRAAAATDSDTATASIQLAQLPTCSPGGVCYTYETGPVCNCPPGTTCQRRCPIRCFPVCFLWWCWTRCERSELCSADFFCD
jgi:hypothetical protein